MYIHYREYFLGNLLSLLLSKDPSKKVGKKEKEEYSKFNEVLQQGKLYEKKLSQNQNQEIKLSRKEKRQKVKDEKKLAKQVLKQKRQRINDEKKLARELKKREREKVKNEKSALKKKNHTGKEKEKTTEKILVVEKVENKAINRIRKNDHIKSSKFNDLVKIILKKNNIKPFPNINAPLE